MVVLLSEGGIEARPCQASEQLCRQVCHLRTIPGEIGVFSNEIFEGLRGIGAAAGEARGELGERMQ
jgi:hypothetical protein